MCRGEKAEEEDEGERVVPRINGMLIRTRDKKGTGGEKDGGGEGR